MFQISQKVSDSALTFERYLGYVKPYVHYGFVPLVVYLGMRTEPRPSLWQIISPM